MSWLGLDGRCAVVTGAGGGIGKAIAEALVAQGAKVALLDLNGDAVAAAAQEMGGLGLACDVTSDESLGHAAAAIEAQLGPVDILVNNAAFLSPGALAEVDIAAWQKMLDVNLTGYLRCAQCFGRPMLARGQGALVHVGSISGNHQQAFSNAYSASKAAVSMLSRQLAYEWGPQGVRSNVVAPGLVRTPLSEAFYADAKTKAAREAVVPMRRIGRVEDIAEAVLFLASDRASYVSGQEIIVDGGYAQTLMSHVPRPGYN
ncbi:SDR family NAD(P)-dependent oxidoreductase [Pseudoprimorskyibacter insulae]|uniref:3-oxoacyl-[acyl-carrier-protein] reductase FabG n=1 Tax=Pseudoprimorskyibacter insulae TaxID=1695997 RepID=A0A2R8AY67_9RHOB|nr:SDR family oxidoreductase [Pseudoprimorskyibacter insulae]SPF80927.1 3-oxoacyl-[acyl-carrier-protein] reductase FabG [Pseudoprimorskyibacter insulae]